MNGGTGFHHKAGEDEPAGGHFNSSVNTVRSHLCRLSKQYITHSEREGGLLSSKGGEGGSQNTFLNLPTDFGHLPWLVRRSVSKVTKEGEM